MARTLKTRAPSRTATGRNERTDAADAEDAASAATRIPIARPRAARPAPAAHSQAEFQRSPRGTLTRPRLRSDLRTSWADAGHGSPGGPAESGDGALGTYLRAIRALVVVIAAVTLATLVGAIAWHQLRTPSYEASADMLVNPLASDDPTFLGLPFVRDPGDPTRTLQTAATLIDSPRAAALAATRLGRGWTPRRVQNAVDVSPQGQSSIVEATAHADSAAEAARVANRHVRAVLDSRTAELRPLIDRAVADTRAQLTRAPRGSVGAQTLADRVRQLENVRDGDPTLSISQPASPPDAPSGLGLGLVLAVALLGGLALGTLVALAIDLIRPRRLADEEELLTLYRLPVLARIPTLPRRWSKQAKDS